MAFFDFLNLNKSSTLDKGGVINIPMDSGRVHSFRDENIENISTVYTAIKILSEAISRVPIHIYDNSDSKGKIKDKGHYLYPILHYAPNPYTNSQTFFSTLEVHRNLRGNAFARIVRNQQTGAIKQLEIINPDTFVDYDILDNQLYYRFKEAGSKSVAINSNEILHFRMLSKDGILGVNPIEALRLNLATSFDAMKSIESFYENNAASPKAIKSTASGVNQKAMLAALKEFKADFSGASKAGKIIPLPPNTELQELKLNFADAQFIGTIKFNADQIASLYGIPPHLVGNFEASKFNNVEQLQLNFKVNTVAAIARMYRQELEFKLLTDKERAEGKSVEFTLQGLVETDHKTRIEGHRVLANIGVVSPNDVAKIEGFKTFDGGDNHFIQTNLMAIEDINQKNSNKNEKRK